MRSRLYEGTVVHERLAPRPHRFRYRVCQLYLDLDELPGVLDAHPLWSARGPAPARFDRRDHLGPAQAPLGDAVRDLVARETGERPRGPIRLLTHPRYLGYVFNPVSFFYVFDPDDRRLEHVVAEVSNTPWGKRHCYVLDARVGVADRRGLAFTLEKRFHVSPFMPMAQRYRWRFTTPGARLAVRMETEQEGTRVFRASLGLAARPLDARALTRALARFPLMTARVTGAIYWQALRLWLKGVPFHEHPKHRSTREAHP